tara:strand:+ start:211 stop:363 length:153 start_codon:yes stop_codon:yes gene_type:complete
MTNEYVVRVQMLPYEGCACGDEREFIVEMKSDLDYDGFMAQLQASMEASE